jgi:hypothetical protein
MFGSAPCLARTCWRISRLGRRPGSVSTGLTSACELHLRKTPCCAIRFSLRAAMVSLVVLHSPEGAATEPLPAEIGAQGRVRQPAWALDQVCAGPRRRFQRGSVRRGHLFHCVVERHRAAAARAVRGHSEIVEAGWIDALEPNEGEATSYTFWSCLRNRWPNNAGVRIDHLLVSEALSPRLLSAGVDRAMRS